MRRGALSYATFRLLFAGQAASAVGDRVVPVALAFAILDLTGSVSDLGLVLAAQTIPLAALVLLGGVWGDRLRSQRVMLASDCVRGVTQALSAVLVVSGAAHVWELVALQAAYGAAEAFFAPAATALVPQTVAAEDIQQANALMGLTANAASVAGPALAGLLVATLGPGWALAFDACTFAVSAICLGLMRVDARVSAPSAGLISDLRGGWRAFRSRTWLWATVAYFTVFLALVVAPFQVLGPAVARDALGGAGAWAAIATALGVGAVLGGIVALRWKPRFPLRVAFLAFLAFGPAPLILLGLHAPLPLIVIAALLDGTTGTFFNVFWYTALQREVPLAELSRVSAYDYLGSLALFPVGLAVCGPIAAVVGVSTTLYAAAGGLVVLTVGALAVPSVRNLRLEDPPARSRAATPDGGRGVEAGTV